MLREKWVDIRHAIDADEESLNGNDGAAPCGPCQRAHAFEVRTRPSTAPAEPPCVYDHPELVTEGPKARIAHLESEIAELRELLEAANAKLACCTCGAAAGVSTNASEPDGLSPSTGGSQQASAATTPYLAPGQVRLTTNSRGEFMSEVPSTASAFSMPSFGALFLSNTLVPFPGPVISTPDSNSFMAGDTSSATFDVLPSAWPPGLPPPAVLYHLVETFFTSVPLASRLIHKPTFMVALRQLPTSLDFPHVALLHAICGIASLYSPIIGDPKKEAARANAAEMLRSPSISRLRDRANGEQGTPRFAKSLYDLKDTWDEAFGVSHIRMASMSLRLSVREGDRLLQMLQAAVICTWYMYSMGFTIGVYVWITNVTKLAGPLGIYASEGFEPLSHLPSNMAFLFGKPKTPVEAETIRNIFWICYTMERIYNAGTSWPLTINDEDISQLMPCRFSDFITGENVPTHNRQRLFTENMLFTHPPLTTDSWTLYIKASILISRVRSLNSRYWISAASKKAGMSAELQGPPTESEEFRHLDQTIASFTRNIPRAFQDPVGIAVDPLLYTAHILPHVAMIQLHDPHAKVDSPNDHSAMQMLAATRAILDLIYKLSGTTYDLLYLDHSCSFGWFIAGVAIIRFLKAKIQARAEDEVVGLEQELGVVKFMLKNLGDRTFIGHRQINVLDEIYNAEIKGRTRRAATAPSATDHRAETDNLMFWNLQ
ncbi:hypothetical protein FS837_002184 [Tulasnella sp. UAMH 9824]|nr:hypothetical protein FS837_002184 [Tulasnella sp. UAMH 9824]